MKEYKRSYPYFSLCGLACGLCPRYQTDGSSRCPGCGGSDFHLKHPSCTVIICSKKHGDFEYCFECPEYPCSRYASVSEKDSFISYRNVLDDFGFIEKNGIEVFRGIMEAKINILETLIKNYNDGRRKNFYCIAVNLLPLDDLNDIMSVIESEYDVQAEDEKTRINRITALFNSAAEKRGVLLKLRK